MRRAGCMIPYRRELTLELARDQERLRELFGVVARNWRDGERALCLDRLCEFDRELRLYLADEGVRFGSYMRHLLSEDVENLELMSRLRVRLRGLSHYIHGIARAHEQGLLQDQAYEEFGRSVRRIGAGLQQVFECQQRLLFPLYRPLSADA
jgi:hypothetical protein